LTQLNDVQRAGPALASGGTGTALRPATWKAPPIAIDQQDDRRGDAQFHLVSGKG